MPKAAKPKPPASPSAPEVRAPAPPVSAGVPATTGPETWSDVPLDAIRRCPFNVRQRFEPKDIAGLGESIRADRLKDPLLVRPVGKDAAPTWDGKQWAGVSHWELIDGERRARALLWICETYPGEAHAAGQVPVIVRPMTDEQVRAVMLVSREQSRDLAVSELVAGYSELRAAKRDDAAVAALVGQTVGHVRSITRLGRLPPWALAAVDAGVLGRSIAARVAQIGGEESRKRAAACVLMSYHDPALLDDVHNDGDTWEEAAEAVGTGSHDCEPLSDRDTRKLIGTHFQRQLKGKPPAPFSLKVVDLVPGVSSCEACPDRAGNNEEAKADGVRADVCLNTDCYRAKVEAHDSAELAKGLKKGASLAPEEFVWRNGSDAPPRGWVDTAVAVNDTELGNEFYGSKRKSSPLADLLRLEDLDCDRYPFYAALNGQHKLRLVMRTADARKALQAAGILKKPEPKPKGEKPTPVAGGRTPGAVMPPADNYGARTRRAAFIASKALAEYGEENFADLADLETDCLNHPVVGALRLIARAHAYAAVADGWRISAQKDVILARFPGTQCKSGNNDEDEKLIDAELAVWSAAKLLAFVLQLSAAVEMQHDGPRRATADAMLAFAGVDWAALESQARRELSGGEPAESKISRAESALAAENLTDSATADPIAATVAEASEDDPPVAVGSVIRTSYGTGPYVVNKATKHGDWWSLTLRDQHKKTGKKDGDSWINEVRRDPDGRITSLGGKDELFVLPAGSDGGPTFFDWAGGINPPTDDRDHLKRLHQLWMKGEPFPARAPSAEPAPTRLTDIDNFPDAVVDALAPAVTTLPTLLDRVEEACAGVDLPLRNKLVTFFVKQGQKLKPAERAADAVAEHVAKSGRTAPETVEPDGAPAPAPKLVTTPKGEPIGPLGVTDAQLRAAACWAEVKGLSGMKPPAKLPRIEHVVLNGRPHLVESTAEHFPGPGYTWTVRPLWTEVQASDRGVAPHPGDPLESLPVEIRTGAGKSAGWMKYVVGAKHEARALVYVPPAKEKAKPKKGAQKK